MMSRVPGLDGAVEEAEWQSAAASTGLMSTRDAYVLPCVMQPTVFVGYDATNLESSI